ncbi:MAG: dihydroorotate dehydrogenase electron transfer subunit [Polyangiaceae bacterium]
MADAAHSKRTLHRLALHRRDSIGAAYHVLTFHAEQPLAVEAGQFAMVRGAAWGDAPLLPRPMSLLTGGHRPSILIKVVGEGTRRMAHASGGEPFDLLAPLGIPWSACPTDRTPLLVAGGVGVAPLVFLARKLGERKALSIYGGRTADDLPMHEELAALGELRVATEDGSRGTRGRVTVALEVALDELARAATPPKVYCCGPDRMMAAVAALCATRGVDCEVSLETPMACGYGVCLGCPVKKSAGGYLYACTEGPCIAAERIDWQATR